MPNGAQQNDDLLKRVASAHAQPVIRKGRNVAAGNLRGWGLEFSDLVDRVSAQPDFAAAQALAAGRSLVTTSKLVNFILF